MKPGLIGILACAVAVCPATPAVAQPTFTDAQLLRCLPKGARLELRPVLTHLDGERPWYLVVFYSSPAGPATPESHVSVLEADDFTLKPVWTVDCHGAYAGFQPDSGVYDINRTGRPKIVVDCEGTTVCPHFFGIFECKDGRIAPVPTDFAPLHTCDVRLQDLDHDGRAEVLNYPHVGYFPPQIYQWNGARYARADGRFPNFWRGAGERYRRAIEGRNPSSPYGLFAACKNALKAFTLARAPGDGRRACEQARDRLRSGRGLTPNLGGETPASVPREAREAISMIDALVAMTGSGLRGTGIPAGSNGSATTSTTIQDCAPSPAGGGGCNNPYWNGGSVPSMGGCLSDKLATSLGISNGCNGSTPFGGGEVFWRFQ